MAPISKAIFRATVANPGDAAKMFEFRRSWVASTVTYNNLPMPQMLLPFPQAVIDTYWGPSVNEVFAPVLNATLTLDVTPSINRWLTGTPNYGWVFVPSNSDGCTIYTEYHPTVAQRMTLDVYLNAPPPPPPPPSPSPPDVGFNPSTIAPNTQITLSVLGTFASPGDTLVLLPAGTPDCTGAVHASSTTGGLVSASMTLVVTIGVSGTYKTCISRLTGPTLDSEFIYLNGPRLIVAMPTSPSAATSMEALAQEVATLSANVAAQSSALSTLSTLSANVAAQSSTLSTLSANVAALSGALSCSAGGRRLDTDVSFSPSVPSEPSESSTAKAIVDDFLSRRPDLAMTLTAEQRAVIEDLGQHFGLPALA
jgi:hypothetical protein